MIVGLEFEMQPGIEEVGVQWRKRIFTLSCLDADLPLRIGRHQVEPQLCPIAEGC